MNVNFSSQVFKNYIDLCLQFAIMATQESQLTVTWAGRKIWSTAAGGTPGVFLKGIDVCTSTTELSAKILKQVTLFVENHRDFFHSFDDIKVHYDNGQVELTRILNLSLNAQLTNVSFLRVKPSEHKLFQLIDMFCSLELTSHKFTTNTASRSEIEMFHNRREFSKNYLKKIRKKRLG